MELKEWLRGRRKDELTAWNTCSSGEGEIQDSAVGSVYPHLHSPCVIVTSLSHCLKDILRVIISEHLRQETAGENKTK